MANGEFTRHSPLATRHSLNTLSQIKPRPLALPGTRLAITQSSIKLLASLVLVKVKEIPPETFGGFSFGNVLKF